MVLIIGGLIGLLLSCGAALAAARVGLVTLPDQQRRIGSLDGIRGYLALGVAVHHFWIWHTVLRGQEWGKPDNNMLTNLGDTAVALFFMVSGCLFYVIVMSSKGVIWRKIYISRFFRIIPLVTFATLVAVAIAWSRGGVFTLGDLSRILVWVSAFGMPDLLGLEDSRLIVAGVYWTLKYEWVFYFGLPVLWFVMRYGQGPASNIALLLMLTLGLVCAAWAFQKLDIKFLRPELFILFLIGMTTYELARFDRVREVLIQPWVAVVAAAVLIYQMTQLDTAYRAESFVLLAAFFLPVVAGNTFFGLFRANFSLALSELSFGIYVLHGIVLSLYIFDFDIVGWTQEGALQLWSLPLIMVSVTLLAAVVHAIVETPMIALGRRFRRQRAALPTIAS